MLGIALVIAAVILLSIFNSSESQSDVSVQSSRGMLIVTFWAVTTTSTTAGQEIICKWLLLRKGVPGDVTGAWTMLIEGVMGTLCLVVASLQGGGISELGGSSIAILMVAALFAFAGIILANYTLAKGLSGVVCAIYNANAFVHVLLSAVFLGQPIPKVQLVALFLLLVGALCISLGDLIIKKLRGAPASCH